MPKTIFISLPVTNFDASVNFTKPSALPITQNSQTTQPLAIVVLSDILRCPMTNSLQNKIPLMEEMSLVRNYIALSKIQCEDCLNYQKSIDEDAQLALIPAITVVINYN